MKTLKLKIIHYLLKSIQDYDCSHIWKEVRSSLRKTTEKNRTGYIIRSERNCEICGKWETIVKDNTRAMTKHQLKTRDYINSLKERKTK